MKKRMGILVYVLVAALMLSILLYYGCLDIGKSEEAMREENRPPEGWYLLESVGESMDAFLSVEERGQDWDLKVYVKRDNAYGWFFRHGSSVGNPYDTVYKKSVEGYGEYVLYSLNQLGVTRIEIEKDDIQRETRNVIPGQPFLLVADQGWTVTLYGRDGQEIRPVEN